MTGRASNRTDGAQPDLSQIAAHGYPETLRHQFVAADILRHKLFCANRAAAYGHRAALTPRQASRLAARRWTADPILPRRFRLFSGQNRLADRGFSYRRIWR